MRTDRERSEGIAPSTPPLGMGRVKGRSKIVGERRTVSHDRGGTLLEPTPGTSPRGRGTCMGLACHAN